MGGACQHAKGQSDICREGGADAGREPMCSRCFSFDCCRLGWNVLRPCLKRRMYKRGRWMGPTVASALANFQRKVSEGLRVV